MFLLRTFIVMSNPSIMSSDGFSKFWIIHIVVATVTGLCGNAFQPSLLLISSTLLGAFGTAASFAAMVNLYSGPGYGFPFGLFVLLIVILLALGVTIQHELSKYWTPAQREGEEGEEGIYSEMGSEDRKRSGTSDAHASQEPAPLNKEL